MTAPHRRGACPGLSAPMPTGDGLLVRLMPAAPVPLDAMAGVCEAARRHGNGTIEVSARGSLQVRGLTPRSAPSFAASVAELGIAVQEGVPVIAEIGDADADLLAAQLRRAIAEARLVLSHKVSVVVDSRGPLHFDGLFADVRLRPAGPDQGPQSSPPRFHLGVGGHMWGERPAVTPALPTREGERRCEGGAAHDSPPVPHPPTFSPLGREQVRAPTDGNVPPTTWLGTVAPKDAVDAVISILSIIASRGPAARAADVLSREGIAALQAAAAIMPAPVPSPRAPAEMIGCHAMRDGTMTLGVGLAFGHTRADALAELVRVAGFHGAHAVRPAPDRALLLTAISAPDARDLIHAAERLGFVVHSDDPRRRIAACPGAPACSSGLIPARTLASELTPVLAPVLQPGRNGVFVHISGCSKGCAHPASAALTLVGTPHGCGIIRHGSARVTPHRYFDPARLGDEIARFTEAVNG